MHTKEDIENLAQFMYLGYKQEHWRMGIENKIFINWSELEPLEKDSWRAASVVALEFKLRNH